MRNGLSSRSTYPAGTEGRLKVYDPSFLFKVVATAKGWLFRSAEFANSTLKIGGSEESLVQAIVAFRLLLHPEGVVIEKH